LNPLRPDPVRTPVTLVPHSIASLEPMDLFYSPNVERTTEVPDGRASDPERASLSIYPDLESDLTVLTPPNCGAARVRSIYRAWP